MNNSLKEVNRLVNSAIEQLQAVSGNITIADNEITRLENMDFEPDTTGLTDYETYNTGFGDVHIKCENENDRQLFNALLDCLKQPNVNRNDLHEYLHQRAGLMAGFHS
jgi:hypothetical protein